MEKIDSPAEVRKWYLDRSHAWTAQSITAHLKLPERSDLNKAVVTLETPTHVGSVTVWGGGTLEFIVLELATKNETLINDKEYDTPEELRQLLDECSRIFSRLTGERSTTNFD